MNDDPPALQDCSPAAGRVYDALADTVGELSREALEGETHHAGRTVRQALADLREAGIVERTAVYPVPRYSLAK